MTEQIDLTYRELCAEMHLRNKGKKGEWNIPSETLVQLFIQKRYGFKPVITRKVKEETTG
jgi:hypothetical protein